MSKMNISTIINIIYGVRRMKYDYFILRHLQSYSTSTSTSTTVKGSLKANPTSTTTVYSNYLISLGFSRQEADPISSTLALSWQKKKKKKKSSVVAIISSSDFKTIWKRRGAETVSDFNFVANAHSVISYFRQMGSCDYCIRRIVSEAPNILVYNVNKTIKPKVKVLMSFGLSHHHILRLICNTPSILLSGLNSCILPSLRLWREFMGTSVTIDDLTFHPNSLFKNPVDLNHLLRNLNFLRDYGVPINNEANQEWIRHHFGFGSYSLYSTNSTLRSVVLMLHENLGIPPTSDFFLFTLENFSRQPISVSYEIIDSKRKLFINFGWTESHVRDLFRALPRILYKSEDTIKEALGFLMNKAGYEPEFLASRPLLLCTDVKSELEPRYQVFKILEEKALLGSGQEFCIAMRFNNEDFDKLFVKPFKDVLQLYGIDVNSFTEDYHKNQQARSNQLS